MHQTNVSGVEVTALRWHTGPVFHKLSEASLLGARIVVAAVLGLLLLASPAAATWSIVAVDSETGEVGAAIASCVPAEVLGQPDQPLVPLVLIPGQAVAVTQAQLNLDAPARITKLIAAAATPDEIIADVVGEEFDEVASLRQHAVVALPAEVAAFTGSDTEPVSLDRQAPGVSVQGNLLVAPDVVDETLSEFVLARQNGIGLASALVEGLLAGSEQGGDRRCGPQTALFAQVVVARPGDSPHAPSIVLTVTVSQGDGQNPVQLLAEAQRQGRTGLLEAGEPPAGSAGLFRSLALVVAAAALLCGALIFKRGLGSTASRR